MPEKEAQDKSAGIAAQVAERIQGSDNVLVALSKNPSVDDLSAALGLTFILDKMGKHATAIFSGAVPNAIEFLEPEKTFEANTNSLRDFIIALDKEKADHLRYKIEGDFVKVFITPYKTTLSEKDLEFSHGDFNVDLVVALNVGSEADLDSALSEYGRIKHDASSINITAGAPGKFGDLEWADPGASSVSEMIAHLSTLLDKDDEGELVEKSTATALLAGIVAATKRFSNDRTSAETMAVASDLMSAGADQQLISSSIPTDVLNRNVVDVNSEVAAVEAEEDAKPEEQKDETELTIEREPKPEVEEEPVAAPAPELVVEAPQEPAPAPIIEERIEPVPEIIPEKPAEAISEPTPEAANPVAPTIEAHVPAPVGEVDYSAEMAAELEQAEATPAAAPEQFPTAAELPAVEIPVAPTPESQAPVDAVPVVAAPMVNEVIETPTTPPTNVAPFQPPAVNPTVPPVNNAQAEYVAPPFPMPGDGDILPPPPAPFTMEDMPPAAAPAAVEPLPSAQSVSQPEPIMPAPITMSEPVPAPAPAPQNEPLPGEIPSTPIQPATPPDYSSVVGPTASSPSVNGVNPVMQDQIYNDPSAFKIPGM